MQTAISFAPMEGITNFIYRSAHAKYFPGIMRYYSPFICPNSSRKLTTREMTDVLPENNPGVRLIPQALTHSAEDFLWLAGKLQALGYDEINLNLGCPSGTVVTKGKGAGQLADLIALRSFFDAVFRDCPIAVSAKTRIGIVEPEEFPAILDVLRQYPFREVIVHPRTREMQYKGTPLRESFAQALDGSPFPVTWNGNLFSLADIRALQEEFPAVHAVMLGRGLIANPGLCCAAQGLPVPEKAVYKAFADEVFDGYLSLWRDAKAVVCHMKEFWSYMISLFPDNAKYAKVIRKAVTPADLRDATARLFDEREIVQIEQWEFRRL